MIASHVDYFFFILYQCNIFSFSFFSFFFHLLLCFWWFWWLEYVWCLQFFVCTTYVLLRTINSFHFPLWLYCLWLCVGGTIGAYRDMTLHCQITYANFGNRPLGLGDNVKGYRDDLLKIEHKQDTIFYQCYMYGLFRMTFEWFVYLFYHEMCKVSITEWKVQLVLISSMGVDTEFIGSGNALENNEEGRVTDVKTILACQKIS